LKGFEILLSFQMGLQGGFLLFCLDFKGFFNPSKLFFPYEKGGTCDISVPLSPYYFNETILLDPERDEEKRDWA
jgi:hypothetical protein